MSTQASVDSVLAAPTNKLLRPQRFEMDVYVGVDTPFDPTFVNGQYVHTCYMPSTSPCPSLPPDFEMDAYVGVDVLGLTFMIFVGVDVLGLTFMKGDCTHFLETRFASVTPQCRCLRWTPMWGSTCWA